MGPIKLLLVDDDHDVGTLIKIRLSREAPHFSVEFVDSGEGCLNFVETNTVDCIISDYQMPGMDGMELLKALRARAINIPFIFVTGQGNEQVAADAFRAGADDYFTKDIGFAHFTRIVNSVEQAVKMRALEAERERALKALIESENRFHKLVEYAADAFYLHDRAGRFMAVNRAACESLGYSREELLSMRVQDIEHGVGQEDLDALWKQCASGRPVSIEGVHRRKDGTTFPIEVRIGTIEMGGEEFFLALARDITRRMQAEEALRESEAKFRSLVEKSLVGVYVIQDGRFTYVNSRLASIFGYDSDAQLYNVKLEDTIAPASRATVLENIRKRTAGEVDSIHYRFRALKADGTEFDVEVYGSFTEYGGRPAVIGTLLDVTDRIT